MNIQRLPKVLTLCSPGRSIAGLLQGIPLLVSCTAQGHKKHRPPSKKKKKEFYISQGMLVFCVFFCQDCSHQDWKSQIFLVHFEQ